MLGWLLVAFVTIPVIELLLLIELGERLGLVPTLTLVLATGLVGGVLARWQGTEALRDVQRAMATGRAPTREMGAGALFLVGAALLLTPGVLTDVAGFALMVPAVRRGVAEVLIQRARESDRVHVHVHTGGVPGGGTPFQRQDDGDVVDLDESEVRETRRDGSA